MYGPELVTFTAPSTDFGHAKPINLIGATIIVDADDFAGIRIAATTLAEDFSRVTNGEPSPVVEQPSGDIATVLGQGDTAIIVGSVTSSPTIRALVVAGQLQVEAIQGKWESFCTVVVETPAEVRGCRKALVICGSDKRGTIFGIYTLSESIGVSP